MAGTYPFDHLAGRKTIGKSTQGTIVFARFIPASQDPTPQGSRYNLRQGFDQAVEGPEAAASIYELQAAVKANSSVADTLRIFYSLTPTSFDGLDRDFNGQTLVCNDTLYIAGMVSGGSIWHDFRVVLDSVAIPIPPPVPPTGIVLSTPENRVEELWAWVNQQWPKVRPVAIEALKLFRTAVRR